MGSIAEAFQKRDRACFIPYFSLGDPDYEKSVAWGRAILDSGADILELGIPFSDPIADGPVIQKAFYRALQHPFHMRQVFATASAIHLTHPEIPLVFLTYFNPIRSFGVEPFIHEARKSGIRGIIIPDLPFDVVETEGLFRALSTHGIDLIHMVTPATEKSRILKMLPSSSGFIYYVTSFGVTGERQNFASDLEKRIRSVQKLSQMPVAAGFGISTPAHAAEIGAYADGVIIGSAIQKIIQEYGEDTVECCHKIQSYCKSIIDALEKVR